jgi:putative polyketide hydroxylase
MAMHGAFDLAWKLAWVLRGWADDRLLDSYESEQRPTAGHYVARSADPHGGIRDHEPELRIDLGGRIPHAWTGPAHARMSTLDLIADGLTLFTGSPGVGWASAAAALDPRVPVIIRSLDDATAQALAIRRDGAVLVRPDGRPVAVWSSSVDADRVLRSAVQGG